MQVTYSKPAEGLEMEVFTSRVSMSVACTQNACLLLEDVDDLEANVAHRS